MSQEPFSHTDASGELRMVDVSAKQSTLRSARASCLVLTSVDALALPLLANGLSAVQSARLEGIQAAKRTAQLIPLCHSLGLDDIHIDVVAHPRGVKIISSATTISRTGVEMEALTASTFCALSLLEALGEFDPAAQMSKLMVIQKSGGKSDWERDVDLDE